MQARYLGTCDQYLASSPQAQVQFTPQPVLYLADTFIQSELFTHFHG